jgi:hypothetical protein
MSLQIVVANHSEKGREPQTREEKARASEPPQESRRGTLVPEGGCDAPSPAGREEVRAIDELSLSLHRILLREQESLDDFLEVVRSLELFLLAFADELGVSE